MMIGEKSMKRSLPMRAALVLMLAAGTLFAPPLQAQSSKVEDAREPAPFDAAHAPAGSTVRFLVFGDWGTGGRTQRRVADGMAAVFARAGADAVLSTGDNFYPTGVKSVDDPQWTSKFETMYDAKALPVPFHAVLGNHDCQGDIQAQIRYTGTRLDDGSVTRWRMPDRMWSERFVTADGAVSTRVIGIDTQIITGRDNDARTAQLRWLDSALSAATEQWIIVVGHHPVYSNGSHGNTLGMIRHVKPLLEKHKVALYLAGHDHDLQVLEPVAGVHYVISGGGGGSRTVRWAANTRYAATNLGFAWLATGAKEMVVRMHEADGTVRWSFSIPASGR